MTKADLIQQIHEQGKFAQRGEVAAAVEFVLETLKNTLENGEKVKIAGFGNFEVREKGSRRGRNPQTGEEITITERKVLTFKPSNVLKARLNAA